MTSCEELVLAKGSYDSAKQEQGGPSGEGMGAKGDWNAGVEFSVDLAKNIAASTNRVEAEADPGEFRSGDQLFDMKSSQKAGGLLFASTLEFVQKGAKGDGLTFGLNYLELTGDVLYGQRVSNNGLIFGGLGPYVAYGLGGKISNGMGETTSFGSTGSFNRLDAGLNLEAGYLLGNGLEFSLGYDLGLVDVSSDPTDFTARNRNFSISVGYSLNKLFGASKKH